MKKSLPAITLLAYVIAIIVCVVNLVNGTPVTTGTIIACALFLIGIIALSTFTLHSEAKKIKSAKQSQEESQPGEKVEKEEIAPQPVEATIPEEEEKITEEAELPEVDVVSTEGADEVDDKEIETPVIIVASKDENDEPDSSDNEEDAEDANVSKFAKSRYIRSYASKLIQADDELKGYYSIIKNTFLSYKKVTCSVSREHERVKLGRTTIGIIKLRGKTILLYLALDPNQFNDTMYVGEDASAISKYAATPFLYRVNGPRKASRAARLIAMMAEKLEMAPTAEPANEDYVARFPYESTEALVEKGLIVDTEAATV